MELLICGFGCTHAAYNLSCPVHNPFIKQRQIMGPMTNPDPETNLQGIKHDNGKPPMELLPHLALLEIAKVLGLGRDKYSAHNWRNGFEWGRLIGAIERHVGAFKDGEDLDPETGITHLAHAGAEVLFLLEHQLRGFGVDNRWKPKS